MRLCGSLKDAMKVQCLINIIPYPKNHGTFLQWTRARVGEFSTSLTLMKAIFINNQRPNRYRGLRFGWVNPLGGNYWNNGVTYFPPSLLCVCLYECVCVCVWELGGGGLSDRWVGHVCFLLSNRYLPEHSTQEY